MLLVVSVWALPSLGRVPSRPTGKPPCEIPEKGPTGRPVSLLHLRYKVEKGLRAKNNNGVLSNYPFYTLDQIVLCSLRLDLSLLASHILLKVALFCTAYHLHKTLKELSVIYKHLGIVYMQNILAFSHDPVYHHHHHHYIT